AVIAEAAAAIAMSTMETSAAAGARSRAGKKRETGQGKRDKERFEGLSLSLCFSFSLLPCPFYLFPLLIDYPSISQIHDSASICRICFRVRDLDDRRPAFIQLLEQLHDFFALARMEVAR